MLRAFLCKLIPLFDRSLASTVLKGPHGRSVPAAPGHMPISAIFLPRPTPYLGTLIARKVARVPHWPLQPQIGYHFAQVYRDTAPRGRRGNKERPKLK